MQGPLNLTTIPLTETVDAPPQVLEGEWLTQRPSVAGSLRLQGTSALSTPHPVITQPKNKSCKALTIALFVRQ